MTKKEALRIAEQISRLGNMGFRVSEAETLRRASMTLSRWCERQSNGEIEDYEGKPHAAWTDHKGERHLYPIPNREAGAMRRIDAIMAHHHEYAWYYQDDPRGKAVYVYRKDHEMLQSYPIKSCYSSIGVAVY